MVLIRALELLSFLLIADVLLRYIQSPSAAPLRWTMKVTEPMYAPLRRILPPVGGLDFTPLVWIVGLHLARSFVADAIY